MFYHLYFLNVNREEEGRKKIKSLQKQIQNVRVEREEEIQQRNQMIAHLKDQLQEMKAKTSMEGKYIQKDAEVAVGQTQKRCMLSEKDAKEEIEVRRIKEICCIWHMSENPDLALFFFFSDFEQFFLLFLTRFLPHFGPPGGQVSYPGRSWLRTSLIICKYLLPVCLTYCNLSTILNNLDKFQQWCRVLHWYWLSACVHSCVVSRNKNTSSWVPWLATPLCQQSLQSPIQQLLKKKAHTKQIQEKEQ